MNQDQYVEITLSRAKNPQDYINVLRELAYVLNKKNSLLKVLAPLLLNQLFKVENCSKIGSGQNF